MTWRHVLAVEVIDQQQHRWSPAAWGSDQAANRRLKIFHAYRFAPDHKLINLEAANAQLLAAPLPTLRRPTATAPIANAPMAAAPAASAPVDLRPQRNAAGGDALDSDGFNSDRRQICNCMFCAMHDVLPAHNVLPQPLSVFG